VSELREAAKEALRWMEHARLHLTIKERMHPDGLSLYDSAAEALRAALAEPEPRPCTCHPGDSPPQPCAQQYALTECKALAQSVTELRDQHKAFTHWYLGLRGINEANFSPEDLAWAAWKAALAQPEPEPVVIGPEWTPCVKLPITVHVREQRPDEQHVSTREGITPVKPDDLIMRGVAGEEYPIGRELFEKTYRIGANPPSDEWRPASEPPEVPRYVGDARKHVICVCPDCVATNYREWRPASEPTEE
jgi:hypothetical protein